MTANPIEKNPISLKELGLYLDLNLQGLIIPANQVSGTVGSSAGNTYFTYNVVTDYGAAAYATAALAAAGTNATTAIQNAINAANAAGGGVVYLPTGYYRISTNLSLFDDVTLVGDGPTASVLVCDDVLNGGVGVIKANGVVASTKSLTADVLFKGRVITVTASGLAVGDWVCLTDTGGFGTTANTNTEFITQVVGFTAGTPDTITLGERVPTPIGYTTARTAQVLKLTPMVEPCVRDIGIQTPTPGAATARSCALDFKYTLNAVIENVRVSGFIGLPGGSGGQPPVYGFRSRNITVRNSSFYKNNDNPPSAGENCRTINVDSSTHVNVAGNEFTRCGGSGVISHQQCAHLVICNNLIGGHTLDFGRSDAGSVAADAGGRGIKILWGCVFFSVVNNVVNNVAYNAIRCDDSVFGTISGNTCYDARDGGIIVAGDQAAAPWTGSGNIVVSGNVVEYDALSGAPGIQIFKSANVAVTGNVVRDAGNGANSGAIFVQSATEVLIADNITDGGDYGVKLDSGAGKCTVHGNRIINCTINSIETSLALGTSHIWGNLIPSAAGGATNLHANDIQIFDTAAHSNLRV